MAEAPLPPTSELWDTLRITAPEAVKYAKQNPDFNPEETVKYGHRNKRRTKFKDKLAPLHCLALMGRSDIITSMLRQYKNIEINVMSFSKKWTPLMFAIQGGHLDVIQQLLDNGAIVNHQANDGRTALHLAVTMGCVVTVEKLLVYSAKVNVQDTRGDAPLHLCMGHVGTGTVKFGPQERKEMATMLVQYGGSICFMNNMGDTPLHLCLHYAHDIQLAQILMTSPRAEQCLTLANDAGHIPLQLATDINTAEMLLLHGSPVDYQGPDGRTVLHIHALQPELITLFIDHKADVNARDRQGRTPLHLAVMDTHAPWQSICHLLMSMDDVNIQDNHGDTPLHLTCYRRQASSKSSPIIDLLLNKGAKLDIQNNKGQTPLFVSLRSVHHKHAKQLLEAGASLDIEDNKGHSSRAICPRWLARTLEGKDDNEASSIGSASNETVTKEINVSNIKANKEEWKREEIDVERDCKDLKGSKSAKSSNLCHINSPSTLTTDFQDDQSEDKSTEEQMEDFQNHFKTLCHEVSSFRELLEEAMESKSNHGKCNGQDFRRKKSFGLKSTKGRKKVENKELELSTKDMSRYIPESVCETAYQMPSDMQLLQEELNTLAAVLQDVYHDDESTF